MELFKSYCFGALKVTKTERTDRFRKTVVAEMHKIGMLIDVSHLNRKSFYDIAKGNKMLIVATHSCSDFICPTKGILTDEQLLKLLKTAAVASE